MPNAAGGHAWAVDHWARLDRFLILGSEGGTFHVGERPLTREGAGLRDVVGFDTATPQVIADFVA